MGVGVLLSQGSGMRLVVLEQRRKKRSHGDFV
jgi:hypothetical protein